jgi:hypothetical protein
MLLLEMPRDAVEPELGVAPARSAAATRARALAALALPIHSGVPVSDSLGLGRQALELAVSEADPFVVAYASSNLGIAALACGRSWGWSLVEKGLSAARAVGDRRELTRITINAVMAALWLGEHARAQSLLQDLRAMAAGTGCRWLKDRAATLGAEIAFRVQGRIPDESEDVLPQEPASALLKARVGLLAGDPDWAELLSLPVAERGFHDGYPDLAASDCARLAEIAMDRDDVHASISWAGRGGSCPHGRGRMVGRFARAGGRGSVPARHAGGGGGDPPRRGGRPPRRDRAAKRQRRCSRLTGRWLRRRVVSPRLDRCTWPRREGSPIYRRSQQRVRAPEPWIDWTS